jgi:hypothetical protein
MSGRRKTADLFQLLCTDTGGYADGIDFDACSLREVGFNEREVLFSICFSVRN